jgi:hypothetical protein
MSGKIAALVVVVICLAGIPGCALVEEEHKGAATENIGQKDVKTETVAMGGYLGKLSGGMIGRYASEKKKAKEETVKKYKYKPSQGVLMRIENASIVPREVKAGQTVEVRITYAVLGTTPRRELMVTETREIKYKGEIIGKPIVHLACEDGTYSSTIPVTLPPDAKRGKYSVAVTVETHKVSASKEAFFYIR